MLVAVVEPARLAVMAVLERERTDNDELRALLEDVEIRAQQSSLTADAFHAQLLSFTAHQELAGEVLAGPHAVQLPRRAVAGMPVLPP